jgi:LacI family transcriptional regulator
VSKSARPTINDVAARAGVSKATVSAALNGTGPVSDETRARVIAVAESLNYRPSRKASHFAARTGRSIGLLVKQLDNPYFAELIAGARDAAREHGYAVLVTSSERDSETERQAVELLNANDVAGIIVTPVLAQGTDLSHLFELKRRNVPFVLIGDIVGVPASVVDVDNLSVSREAAEHLIALGHTQIAHFAGPADSMHAVHRVDGVRRACSAARIAFGDDDVIPTGTGLEDGYRAGLAYFRDLPAERRPTAVTCYNDLVAIGLCRALRQLGLRVPEDVAVVGFDDIPLLEYLPVPLTSVRVPASRMGRTATELLVRDIESRGEALPSQRVFLEAELMRRRSTEGSRPARG